MSSNKKGLSKGLWGLGFGSDKKKESSTSPLLHPAGEHSHGAAMRTVPAGEAANRNMATSQPSESAGGTSLVDIVRSASKASATSRVLPCGAIEALPLLSGDDVADKLLRSGVDSLPDLLQGRRDQLAITGVKGGVGSAGCSISHGKLAEFVSRGGGLPECGVGVGDRVGVLLPNGPEMAICLLACMASCVAMPINHQMVCFPSLLSSHVGSSSS